MEPVPCTVRKFETRDFEALAELLAELRNGPLTTDDWVLLASIAKLVEVRSE